MWTEIKLQVTPFEFGHISLIFLICNDKNIQKRKEVQDCKILKLGKNSLSRNNSDKVIYNFSSVTLSDSDKSLLSKGLNFALPPVSLEYSEYLVDYELFSRDTVSLETSHLDRELLKGRFKNVVFSYFKTYNSSRRPNNLTSEEFESLLKLSKNKDVVIQKSGKRNSVVFIDKAALTNRIQKLLDNPRQFPQY